jgi:hypothetical protein
MNADRFRKSTWIASHIAPSQYPESKFAQSDCRVGCDNGRPIANLVLILYRHNKVNKETADDPTKPTKGSPDFFST